MMIQNNLTFPIKHLGISSNKFTYFRAEDPTKAALELSPPFHLVSCEYNSKVRIVWNTPYIYNTYTMYTPPIYNTYMYTSKDGNLLAGGCYNGQVWIFDLFLSGSLSLAIAA